MVRNKRKIRSLQTTERNRNNYPSRYGQREGYYDGEPRRNRNSRNQQDEDYYDDEPPRNRNSRNQQREDYYDDEPPRNRNSRNQQREDYYDDEPPRNRTSRNQQSEDYYDDEPPRNRTSRNQQDEDYYDDEYDEKFENDDKKTSTKSKKTKKINIKKALGNIFSRPKQPVSRVSQLIPQNRSIRGLIVFFLLFVIVTFSLITYIINSSSYYQAVDIGNEQTIVINTENVQQPGFISPENEPETVSYTTLNNLIPQELSGDIMLNEQDFLNYLKNNKEQFCFFAEQSRNAHILANNQIRGYSVSQYPLDNLLINYNDCMNNNIWNNNDIFLLYQNLYLDFINTNRSNADLLVKLEKTKNQEMKTTFNIIDDFPVIFEKDDLLSLENFSQIVQSNYINQLSFCNYSHNFAKAYDVYITNQKNSLLPVQNCYSFDLNIQEAYQQYEFYFKYIQEGSQEYSANTIQTSTLNLYP